MAPLIDGSGEEFLTGPAFAKQEDACVGLGGPLRCFDHGLNGRTVPDDGGVAAGDFRTEIGDLPLQRVPLQCLANNDEQVILLKGLGQKVVGAFFHGFDRGMNRAVGGHDDDRKAVRLL
ncbi:MAG: hypothetical protein EWM72_03306 [Nitrospira sp.]|nr:MAG: hypothetical protein EWM72_03306 [Nitrospira sp.]